MPRGNSASAETDGISDALGDGEAIDAMPLDRAFYAWYWPLIAPPADG